MEKHILTINGGSSSIKFALYANDGGMTRLQYGRIERIGLPDAVFITLGSDGKEVEREMHLPDMQTATASLCEFLSSAVDFDNVAVIAHRIVHGMDRATHEVITPHTIDALKSIAHLDPEHLPAEIGLVEMFLARYPALMHVACFDTVFHSTLPRVAQLLPFPRRFESSGLRRYGFHGLSCSSLMSTLKERYPDKQFPRVVILHLGSGASVTAVLDGKSVDTSMGFTPAGGIPMGTRTGDIDPGALCHIMKTENLSPDAASTLVNHASGLLGISETSADMYNLLSIEASDMRAKEAIDYFSYEVKKRIGAYAAVLGGVDAVIFAGGMGERASRIRARICAGLEFLGIALDEAKNNAGAPSISPPDSPVLVEVMHTDEEKEIARIARGFIS